MKLLAVFGLALAVSAVDNSTYGHLKSPMGKSQVLLELFKFDPNNPIYRSEILSNDPGYEICEAVEPKEVFLLIRDCLETGRSFLPKDLLKMDMVHVAALIFMLRAQGNEETAEPLYNAVMKKYFPKKFEAKLHKQLYPRDPLVEFKRLEALNPLEETNREAQLLSNNSMANHKRLLLNSLKAARKIVHETQSLSSPEAARKMVHETQSRLEAARKMVDEMQSSLVAARMLVRETQSSLEAARKLVRETQLLRSLKANREKQFFMLWTVWMYGKNQGVHQMRLLEDADQVLLILASMEIPIGVLAAGLIALQKELSVDVTPDLLFAHQLMFFSLNRGWYLGLGELEKAQLRAFLERYLIAKLQDLSLQAETFLVEGVEQLRKAFESEDEFRCKYLGSDTIAKFAGYFCNVTQAGCPAFLLKRMLDF